MEEKSTGVKGEQEFEHAVVHPPSAIFKNKKADIKVPSKGVFLQDNGAPLRIRSYICEKVTCPDEGGIYKHMKGIPYPQKCFPFPEAVYATNMAKRMVRTFLSVISSWDMFWPVVGFMVTRYKTKIRIMERAIKAFNDSADKILNPFYLEEKRYATFNRELRKFIAIFLYELGIDYDVGDRFAEVFATIIEYDDAYRLRAEDIFSTTTVEKLIKSPAAEVMRLGIIAWTRDNGGKGGPTADKFRKIAEIIRLMLWFPKVRKAFVSALYAIDFKNLQLDEADRFYCLTAADYNFFGMVQSERLEMYKKVFEKIPYPPIVEYEVQM